MPKRWKTRRLRLWVGLGAALTLGALLFGFERGRARASERLTPDEEGVAEARALVNALEAKLRSTEASLKKAKEVLAQLEGAGQAAEKPITKNDALPADDEGKLLEGVWRIVGIGGNESGVFQKPPYDEYKIMTAGHYLWLSLDPDTGKVIRSGGGVFTLKDGKYTAHIECSNAPDLQGVIGQDYTGTCKLDGKRWYHFGKVPSGGVFDELWERVH
jgi:hypothetical protein